MNNIVKFAAAAACALAMQGQAWAAEHATPAEATAMVKKAIEFIKANGKEKAYAAINDPKGQFRDRDLYVFVYDMYGVTQAHGANPKMLGKNLMELKDADGVYIIKAFLDVGKTKGKGWVDYKWPNPVSKDIESKSTYIEKYDDVLVGAGVYK
ncbi:MAG: cache domain-containing protein [Pseudomonadota bacterium]